MHKKLLRYSWFATQAIAIFSNTVPFITTSLYIATSSLVNFHPFALLLILVSVSEVNFLQKMTSADGLTTRPVVTQRFVPLLLGVCQGS